MDRGDEMGSSNEIKSPVASGHKGAMRLALVASAALLLIEPSIAAAAPWDAAVSAIAGTLQGTLGKAIAVIAVIVLGLMAMAGKLEWMTAIKVVIGIVIMFSAGQIINWIAPNANVSEKITMGDANVLAYDTQVACIGAQGVWVPASPELKFADGTVANHYHAAYCVDTNNGADLASATAACQTTTNMAAGTLITSAAPVTYFAGTSATAIAGGTCN